MATRNPEVARRNQAAYRARQAKEGVKYYTLRLSERQKASVDYALMLEQTSGGKLEEWLAQRDSRAAAELRRVKRWRTGWAWAAFALGFLALPALLSGRWGL